MTSPAPDAPSSARRRIDVGLSLMPSEDFRRATAPLFDRGLVDALEWNVDMGFAPARVPGWVEALLDAYAERDRLYAHGVELSPLSARLLPHQTSWLDDLEKAFERRRYVHLTDHYGFMTAGTFVRGTPLPLPPSEAALSIATQRLLHLRRISGRPVGLENLALAFGPEDTDAQPSFLDEALARADGFLLLDLHNVYCQLANFGGDASSLLSRYPLERVRELHVAGGSFSTPRSDPRGRPFRRDTHDDAMPDGVLALLDFAIAACPSLEVVILERTDRSLFGEEEAARFRDEVARLREIVAAASARAPATPERPPRDIAWLRDDERSLDRLQGTMLEVFAREDDPAAAIEALRGDDALSAYAPWTASFEPRAVEVGIGLVRQWGTRAPGADTMLAAVLPRTRATLELRHVPTRRPGPGQARLRVRACGLCGTDVHIREGRMGVPLPIVLGHEIVGVVEELGEGVANLRVGARVGVPWTQAGCGACDACARGRVRHCADPKTWLTNGGGLAEATIVDALGCVPLPDDLAFEEAAPLFCAGFTVMSAYRRAAPRPGDRVAVLGVGGLGHLALQIAKTFGHEVVAITSSPDKERELVAAGADEVLLAGDDPGRVLADAGGADVVLATTSSARHLGAAVTGLRPDGRLALVGLGDGAVAIDPMSLILSQGSIVGAMQSERGDLVDVLELAARGQIRPRVEAFPLVLVERAMTRLAEGRVRYRAVVTC